MSFTDEDCSTFYGNTSHLFAAALLATKDGEGRMQVAWVAFGPSGSFFLQRKNGDPFWHGLPKDLEELVAKYPRDVVHLTLGRPQGWWVLSTTKPGNGDYRESMSFQIGSTARRLPT